MLFGLVEELFVDCLVSGETDLPLIGIIFCGTRATGLLLTFLCYYQKKNL